MSHVPAMTYPEAMVVGLIQGVTELFPVSSLGHNVLIPALIGGTWARALNVAAPESPYLAFIVGLHVATAIALLIYFWHDWVRIIRGFFTSIRDRDIVTSDQKLAWMIIVATIPVGLVGLVFEHTFRVLFGKPILAAIFLVVNGMILFSGEKFRTKKSLQADEEATEERRLATAPVQAQPAPAAGVTAFGGLAAATDGGATVGPARRPGPSRTRRRRWTRRAGAGCRSRPAPGVPHPAGRKRQRNRSPTEDNEPLAGARDWSR